MAGEEIMMIGYSGWLIAFVFIFIVMKAGWGTVLNEFRFQMFGRKGAVEVELVYKNGSSKTIITKNAKDYFWGKDKATGLDIKTEFVKPYNSSVERKLAKYFVVEGETVNYNFFEKPSMDITNKRVNYAMAEMKQVGRLQATLEMFDKLKQNKYLFWVVIIGMIASIGAIAISMQNMDLLTKIAAKTGVEVSSGGGGIGSLFGIK